jgi:hypothetical protein
VEESIRKEWFRLNNLAIYTWRDWLTEKLKTCLEPRGLKVKFISVRSTSGMMTSPHITWELEKEGYWIELKAYTSYGFHVSVIRPNKKATSWTAHRDQKNDTLADLILWFEDQGILDATSR